MDKPLAIDLFCGLGGWAEGFLAEGYEIWGYDIEAHRYPKYTYPDIDSSKGMSGKDKHGNTLMNRAWEQNPGYRGTQPTGEWMEYPGRLICATCDRSTAPSSKMRAVIVASPPCQAYSYRAMPWKRAKALPPPDNTLFNECFRIQRQACEAAGRYIPLIVENVRGAQKWVGRARWNYGSFYLWGDVPALMPHTLRVQKFNPDGTGHGHGSWFAIADSKERGSKGIPHRPTGHWTNPTENGLKLHDSDGYERNHPQAFGWKSPRTSSSAVSKRKAASAMIAKIPFPLAQHIARVFKPVAA